MTDLTHPAFGGIEAELIALDIPPDERAEIIADVLKKAMEQRRASERSQAETLAVLARLVHRTRLKGNGFLGTRIMSDPKFEMLLEMFVANHEDRRVSVSDLCYSANAPQSTCMRHLQTLEAKGFLTRIPDMRDARRWWIKPTEQALEGVSAYMTELGRTR